MYQPLKVGSVTPQGWLKKQLQLQAQGLAGYLPLFWADIQSSSWIGGNADGGLHERTPYWLNGMVSVLSRLHFLLAHTRDVHFPLLISQNLKIT